MWQITEGGGEPSLKISGLYLLRFGSEGVLKILRKSITGWDRSLESPCTDCMLTVWFRWNFWKCVFVILTTFTVNHNHLKYVPIYKDTTIIMYNLQSSPPPSSWQKSTYTISDDSTKKLKLKVIFLLLPGFPPNWITTRRDMSCQLWFNFMSLGQLL